MTRRSLFATVAAAIAGRKVAPAAVKCGKLGIDTRAGLPPGRVVTYRHVQYGLGFEVPAHLLDDDAIHFRLHQQMAAETLLRRERLAAEVFQRAFTVPAPTDAP